MARPKSEDKRDALMAAATRVIAAQGLSAPTAVIAREAGVSNGSLFTYFETKADLFNHLYLELKTEMATASLNGLPANAPLREQLSRLWSNWMRWAMSAPGKRRAIALLGVSDDITQETQTASHLAMADVAEVLEQVRARGPMRDAPMGFVLALMNSLADATTDFMIGDPANAGEHCKAGFDALCRMLGCLFFVPAYIITGPTSGIGYRTALELARHGTVVLAGRDQGKLDTVGKEIERAGGRAVPVVCDLSDPASVRRAAAEIVALPLQLAGLVNNAGTGQTRATKNAQGWDTVFATNHLGPFVLTEALMPHLPDGANVVFVCSGVEDPERRPAVIAGFRGGRYISAEASARGEWKPGGSTHAGFDSYATSKQCELATALAFARETPRLRVNAVEPGFNPSTGPGRDANVFLRLMAKYVLSPLAPFIRYWSTSARAGQVITSALLNEPGVTGVYYDERGKPMLGSTPVRDPEFQDRVVAETRALLATVPA